MHITRRITAALVLIGAMTFPITAFAKENKGTRRTIVVRDGKVVESSGDEPFIFGKRAYIGVRVTELSAELREHFGVDKEAGVLVASVEAGSPAEKAGLRVGDIITSLDGKSLDDTSDLRRSMNGKHEGDSVRLEVTRGKTRQTIVASVAEREFAPPHFDLEFFREGNFRDLPGVEAFQIGPEWKARVMSLQDCGELQTRIKDLETRLKDLEKKLQK